MLTMRKVAAADFFNSIGTRLTVAVFLQSDGEATLTLTRLRAQVDPLRTILRLGHVADGAIVSTAADGRNRFGKFSAPAGSNSRKRTFLRMTPSFHWTATDLCRDCFVDLGRKSTLAPGALARPVLLSRPGRRDRSIQLFK
jgi:hypothetical protein